MCILKLFRGVFERPTMGCIHPCVVLFLPVTILNVRELVGSIRCKQRVMGLLVGVSSLHLRPFFLLIVLLITSLTFLLYHTDSPCVMLREDVCCCSLWEWAVVQCFSSAQVLQGLFRCNHGVPISFGFFRVLWRLVFAWPFGCCH